MDELIQEAIDRKRIYKEDGERIQKNIDAVSFLSPRGREEAIKECIKHIAKCKKIIELAIREDKRARGILKQRKPRKEKEYTDEDVRRSLQKLKDANCTLNETGDKK